MFAAPLCFLTDLTRIQSARACLPPGRRIAAPARGRRNRIHERRDGGSPLANGLAPPGNGPEGLPLQAPLIGPGALS